MSPATTYEVLHRIGQTFSHVQHAVCGNAAMVAYGFTARPPSHVSVVCPVYAREVIKSWAAATGGMAIYPGDPDVIGVADADGEVWKVRIKPLDGAESFEMLETVGMAFGGDGAVTRVLTMPALVNQIALSYVHERHVGDESRMAALAGDLVWLLGRICEEGAESEHLLRAKSVPAVRDPRFWSDFTTAYPEIAGLFYDAGFRPDGCPTIGDSRGSERASARPDGSERFASQESRTTNRRRRSHANSGARFRRRLREGPNMTRAEIRRVMVDRLSSRRPRNGC